jgi:hypothetical protein
MLYTLERKKTDGGVISTYSGKVTDAEFQQCMKEKFFLSKEILSPEKVEALRYSISDCADVSNFDVSVEAVKWVTHLSKTVMKTNPTILMAIITPNNHEFGMARLWQTYMGIQGERAKGRKGESVLD